jgi:hypothetical protein
VSADVIAGVSCDGHMAHLKRLWAVDADRRASWRDADWLPPLTDAIKRALAVPIPGTAAVVACNAWTDSVLLADGSLYAMNFNPQRPHWTPLTKECDMSTKTSTPPLYVAGGSGCGCMWAVDHDRRVWTFVQAVKRELAPKPVPGANAVLAVDTTRAAVMLDSGEQCLWTGTGWVMLPPLGTQTVRVRGIGASGVTTTAGNLNPGEVLGLPYAEALEYIRMGRCEVVAP